jgi:hypothetical protein
MNKQFSVNEDVLYDMAQTLLDAMSKENKTVDQDLLKTAENLITSHHFYVQLLFVKMIIERMRSLDSYYETMDALTEDVSTDDIGEMTSSEKIRGIQAICGAVKIQLDIVNTMLASKDASAAMISSLKESFSILDPEDREKTEDILKDISTMSPLQRQRVLKGTVHALRQLAQKEKVSS